MCFIWPRMGWVLFYRTIVLDCWSVDVMITGCSKKRGISECYIVCFTAHLIWSIEYSCLIYLKIEIHMLVTSTKPFLSIISEQRNRICVFMTFNLTVINPEANFNCMLTFFKICYIFNCHKTNFSIFIDLALLNLFIQHVSSCWLCTVSLCNIVMMENKLELARSWCQI